LFVMVVVLVWKSTKPGAGKGRRTSHWASALVATIYYTISVPE